MFGEKGQSLLELVVVIAVVVIVIGALTFATIASLRNASFSQNQAQATKLAQEGIERVRIGRDRNQLIINLSNVTSWNGNTTGVGSIWDYPIYSSCETAGACYFKITNSSGALSYLISSTSFPTSGYEDPYGDSKFKRAIILSDNANIFRTQKTVTAIVQWSDFSGSHESRLTTILRKV